MTRAALWLTFDVGCVLAVAGLIVGGLLIFGWPS